MNGVTDDLPPLRSSSAQPSNPDSQEEHVAKSMTVEM